MTWLDYGIVGIVLVSLIWGAWRGLVREIISILGWVIAFLAANLFAGPLGETMPETIPSPELRLLVAFLIVFVGALAVATLLGLVLSKIVHAIGLGSLDRTLGSLFGIARGGLIVLAFALLAGLTDLPRTPIWRDSVAGAPLAQAAMAIKPWLPTTFTARLRYD
ncbi:MAG: CvpA family protein [Burkholderiales bacterium]